MAYTSKYLPKLQKYTVTINYSDGTQFTANAKSNYSEETLEKVWRSSGIAYWSRKTNKKPDDNISIKKITITRPKTKKTLE